MRQSWLVSGSIATAVVLLLLTTIDLISTKNPQSNLLATAFFQWRQLQRRKRCFAFNTVHSFKRQQHVSFSARSTSTTITSTTAATADRATSHENTNETDDDPLLASRLGLDPLKNRFHAPIVYHERYSFADWPPNHTFPMNKFERIAHALQTTCKRSSTATSNLPRPIIRTHNDFFRPLDLPQIPYNEWFYSIIDQDFVVRFLEGRLTDQEARTIGFGAEQTSRPELIERTVLEVAGTILTCQLASRFGIASNVAGGTHHAHPTGGAGYTILNDLAVASNFLLTRKHTTGVQRILVIDCDVHQGDGTAKFSNTIPGIFTLSLHCESNYPMLKAKSTFDVGIQDGCHDDEYLKILETSVNHAMDSVCPDFVLYDAGVDIYEHDRLGRLNISQEGIRKRDRWVLDRCVSAGIPRRGSRRWWL